VYQFVANNLVGHNHLIVGALAVQLFDIDDILQHGICRQHGFYAWFFNGLGQAKV